MHTNPPESEMMVTYKHKPNAARAISFRTNRADAIKRVAQLEKELPTADGEWKYRMEGELASLRDGLAKSRK